MEQAIDRMSALLPPLQGLILPGGHSTAATAHVARTLCRRSERRSVSLSDLEDPDRALEGVAIYLNRLSDYFFALARYCNHLHGVQDVPRE